MVLMKASFLRAYMAKMLLQRFHLKTLNPIQLGEFFLPVVGLL